MKAEGIEPELPALEVGSHLITHLFEVGPVSVGMGSASPISWVDLAAWQEQTGVELQPWEARLVRRLSREYASETQRAQDPAAASPLAILATEKVRETVARHTRGLFGGIAASMRQKNEKGRR